MRTVKSLSQRASCAPGLAEMGVLAPRLAQQLPGTRQPPRKASHKKPHRPRQTSRAVGGRAREGPGRFGRSPERREEF